MCYFLFSYTKQKFDLIVTFYDNFDRILFFFFFRKIYIANFPILAFDFFFIKISKVTFIFLFLVFLFLSLSYHFLSSSFFHDIFFPFFIIVITFFHLFIYIKIDNCSNIHCYTFKKKK